MKKFTIELTEKEYNTLRASIVVHQSTITKSIKELDIMDDNRMIGDNTYNTMIHSYNRQMQLLDSLGMTVITTKKTVS